MTRKFAQIKGVKPNLYVSAPQIGAYVPCGSKENLAQVVTDAINRAHEAGKNARSAEIRALLEPCDPPDSAVLQL